MPRPMSQGQGERRRGLGSNSGGYPAAPALARRRTCVTAVAWSTVRVPERTIVAASAVSPGTCPPLATVSRSASIATADW